VVVTELKGQSDFALEIYGKNILDLPDDTVGRHIAESLGQPVIIPDSSLSPYGWQLLFPDGSIEDILMDIDKLDVNSTVEYKPAEQRH
jgi:hypothetical protein